MRSALRMAESSLGEVLGARLRARRQAKQLSQAKLAELVELTPNYLGSIERGEAVPTLQTLEGLAGALGVSVADLLGDTTTEGDAWLDELLAVAHAVARARRALALDVLKAVATAREHDASEDGG